MLNIDTYYFLCLTLHYFNYLQFFFTTFALAPEYPYHEPDPVGLRGPEERRRSSLPQILQFDCSTRQESDQVLRQSEAMQFIIVGPLLAGGYLWGLVKCQRRILRRGCKEDQGITSTMAVWNGYFNEIGKVSVPLLKVLHEWGYSGRGFSHPSLFTPCFAAKGGHICSAEEIQVPFWNAV